MEDYGRFACWLATGLLAVGTVGCDQVEEQLAHQCRLAKADYESAVDEERTELTDRQAEDDGADAGSGGDERRAHFGLTLSDDLVSKLANFVVEPILDGALALASTVTVDGQSVSLESEGDVVDLAVEADGACDHCFRLSADLGGAIVARLPSGATKRASLGGSASLVAPLIVGEGDEKSTAVKLDLPQAAEMATAQVDPSLYGIAPEFAEALQGPLAQLLERRVLDRLEPVTLAQFDGPSFGIDGFELRATRLRSDAAAGSVFVGFATNVAALNDGDVPPVSDVTDLGENEDVALSFHPGLVWRVLSLLIERGDVARRYTRSGAAESRGDFRVALSGFRQQESAEPAVSADASTDTAVETGADAETGTSDQQGGANERATAGLDFSMHRFGSGNLCFSASARALGSVGVRDDALQVSLDDVEITRGAIARRVLALGGWGEAEFLGETESIIQTSLEADRLTVPGTQLAVGPVGVDISANAVTLRGTSELE